ncbi:MAG: hypothetical protein FWG87_14155, partial [Defluviitaleaceae bacterium]|nr:hypothetical protein [Defluviitaleaceae bacterium]
MDSIFGDISYWTRIYADFHGLRGLARGKIRIIRENPLNPCSINNNRWRLILVTVTCRGGVYPSRGMHVIRAWYVQNPSPTNALLAPLPITTITRAYLFQLFVRYPCLTACYTSPSISILLGVAVIHR